MICSLNILMTDCCVNSWIFCYQSRMIIDYDCNVDPWFDILTLFCESKMRNDSIKEITTMIDEENDTSNSSFRCCIMIEANMTAMNRISYHSNCLNDCVFRIIFHHMTHLFNQLQRRIAWNRRIQNASEQYGEDHQKHHQKNKWWNWSKRWRRKQFWFIWKIKINDNKIWNQRSWTVIHHKKNNWWTKDFISKLKATRFTSWMCKNVLF